MKAFSLLLFSYNTPILYSTIELLINADKFTNALPVPLEYFGTESTILTYLYTPGAWEKEHSQEKLFPLATNALTMYNLCSLTQIISHLYPCVSCGLRDSVADVSCGHNGLSL